MTSAFSVDLLFGSETGNCIDICEKISLCLKMRSISCSMKCMNDYNILSELQTKSPVMIIFVCSTTGDGDVPYNMKQFWNICMSKDFPNRMPINSFHSLSFTVFGLGDSSYLKYNVIARKLFQRFLNLGAKAFHERGLGDDQHQFGYQSVFDPWLQKMLNLKQFMTFHNLIQLPALQLKYNINHAKNESNGNINICYAKVLENKRLTPINYWKDIRFISFDINMKNSNLHLPFKYYPGDVLLIYPCNPIEITTQFITKVLKLELDIARNTFITIDKCDENASDFNFSIIENNCEISIFDLCRYHLDICGSPRRSFFSKLAELTNDEQHKEKLLEFCSMDGSLALREYNLDEWRNFVEVFIDFHSCDVNLQQLMSLIPILKPRKYSVCSYDENTVSIIVSVVEHKTPLNRFRMGLCSHFVTHELKVGDRCPIWLERGSFLLKRKMKNWLNPKQKILMIGVGTGIAPMRSMIQYLHERRIAENDNKIVLFFGNRKKESDFLFGNEWDKYSCIHRMILAFSRDSKKKVYVTHKMKENASLVWKWISDGCLILASGSSKNVPKDIKKSLMDICVSEGKMTQLQANSFFNRLQNTFIFQGEFY